MLFLGSGVRISEKLWPKCWNALPFDIFFRFKHLKELSHGILSYFGHIKNYL